jgi:Transglycosylase SLT domain
MQITRPRHLWSRLACTGFLALTGLLLMRSAAPAATQAEVTQIIADEAARNGHVPLPMALAVAKVESDMREDALSTAGARGVMQIMPATAMSEFGVPASALGEPRLNVRLGIAYLERLNNRYGGDWQLALSHYNGGALPATAGHYVAHDYTRQYVADVMKWADVYRNDATLMAALANHGAAPPVQLASADASPPPAVADQTTKPPAAAPLSPDARDRVADATYPPISYPSGDELRARFRANLERRREALAQPADGGTDAGGPPQAPKVRPGRFTYAPYGS